MPCSNSWQFVGQSNQFGVFIDRSVRDDSYTSRGGWEGLRLKSYPDVIGVWTACYGETKDIKPGMAFTKDQCDAMLIESLIVHENGMLRCVTRPMPEPVHASIRRIRRCRKAPCRLDL